MKSYINKKILFLVALSVVCFLSMMPFQVFISTTNYISNENASDNLKTSVNIGRIHINKNWSDTKIAGICTGDGTETNPYVIQDYVINGSGIGSCILIENTTDYFRIENCSVFNWGVDTYDAGIKLLYVNNGKLTNNNASSDDAYGLVLENSLNNILVGNIIRSQKGIRFFQSNNSIVYLNDVEATLIDLEYRLSNNNRFHTLKRMVYIFNGNQYTSYLGNHWLGYASSHPDSNIDGIGDEPVIFDMHLPSSQWVYVDYYPLMETLDNYQILSEVTEEGIPGFNLYIMIGLICTFTILILHRQKKFLK